MAFTKKGNTTMSDDFDEDEELTMRDLSNVIM